jgi:hypothetical protein
MSSGSRKRPREPEEPSGGGDDLLGGLYDFLPPPDPEKEAAAKAAAKAKELKSLPEEDRSRVIFLDIDGVLLPAGSLETIFIDGAPMPVRARLVDHDFPTSAMNNLRSIVLQTGASIVLSSEWRRTESMKDSIGIALRTRGLPQLRGSTPVFKPRPELLQQDPGIIWCERRAREIGAWLKQNPDVKAWVALDDLDFNWADSTREHGTPLIKYRSVHTNAQRCLTEEDAAEAVQLLLQPRDLSEAETIAAVDEARSMTQAALLAAPQKAPGQGGLLHL